MELYEAIEKRRTIRSFRKPASEEQLHKIILAGTKAPSGGNSQPWEFIVIDDRQIIGQIAEIKYRLSKNFKLREGENPAEIEERSLKQKLSFANASVLAVCTKTGGASAGWLCIENMSLAAVADGLGSCIVTYWGSEMDEVKEILGIPAGYNLVAVMKFGEPGEEGFPRDKNPDAPRRPEFSWLHRNKF
jgi:5,6-dimethylbenzimidazole synthase